jgi:hypothetical protein
MAEKLTTTMLSRDGVDAFVTNVAGCGSTLKEYAHLLEHSPLAAEGKRFQAKMKDINEFLMELGPIKSTHPVKIRATYHDACHLCHAQKIRQAPRDLLGLIPGSATRAPGMNQKSAAEQRAVITSLNPRWPNAWAYARRTTSWQPSRKQSSPPTPAACYKSPSNCERVTPISSSPTP